MARYLCRLVNFASGVVSFTIAVTYIRSSFNGRTQFAPTEKNVRINLTYITKRYILILVSYS